MDQIKIGKFRAVLLLYNATMLLIQQKIIPKAVATNSCSYEN